MIRSFKILSLILTLGLTMPIHAADANPPKPEEVPTPPPVPALTADEAARLGNLRLPPDVVQKLDAKQLENLLETQLTAPKSVAESVFNQNVFVPTVMFAGMTAISFGALYFSFRKRREMLDTVRIAIQSGQTLPASVLEALESKRRPTPDGDLRKAVLLIAIGLGGMVVLATLGEQEAGRAWSIGLVPTLLGIGYLFLWRQSQKKGKAGLSDDQR